MTNKQTNKHTNKQTQKNMNQLVYSMFFGILTTDY